MVELIFASTSIGDIKVQDIAILSDTTEQPSKR